MKGRVQLGPRRARRALLRGPRVRRAGELPGRSSAVWASVRRDHLDCALACGANPATGDLLAVRAAHLTGRRCRAELAESLELMTRRDRPPSRFGVEPCTPAVDRNRARMSALADRLRDPAPVYARGVAMLRLLLRDGSGPLYMPGTGVALEHALRETAEALAGRWAT